MLSKIMMLSSPSTKNALFTALTRKHGLYFVITATTIGLVYIVSSRNIYKFLDKFLDLSEDEEDGGDSREEDEDVEEGVTSEEKQKAKTSKNVKNVGTMGAEEGGKAGGSYKTVSPEQSRIDRKKRNPWGQYQKARCMDGDEKNNKTALDVREVSSSRITSVAKTTEVRKTPSPLEMQRKTSTKSNEGTFTNRRMGMVVTAVPALLPTTVEVSTVETTTAGRDTTADPRTAGCASTVGATATETCSAPETLATEQTLMETVEETSMNGGKRKPETPPKYFLDLLDMTSYKVIEHLHKTHMKFLNHSTSGAKGTSTGVGGTGVGSGEVGGTGGAGIVGSFSTGGLTGKDGASRDGGRGGTGGEQLIQQHQRGGLHQSGGPQSGNIEDINVDINNVDGTINVRNLGNNGSNNLPSTLPDFLAGQCGGKDPELWSAPRSCHDYVRCSSSKGYHTSSRGHQTQHQTHQTSSCSQPENTSSEQGSEGFVQANNVHNVQGDVQSSRGSSYQGSSTSFVQKKEDHKVHVDVLSEPDDPRQPRHQHSAVELKKLQKWAHLHLPHSSAEELHGNQHHSGAVGIQAGAHAALDSALDLASHGTEGSQHSDGQHSDEMFLSDLSEGENHSTHTTPSNRSSTSNPNGSPTISPYRGGGEQEISSSQQSTFRGSRGTLSGENQILISSPQIKEEQHQSFPRGDHFEGRSNINVVHQPAAPNNVQSAPRSSTPFYRAARDHYSRKTPSTPSVNEYSGHQYKSVDQYNSVDEYSVTGGVTTGGVAGDHGDENTNDVVNAGTNRFPRRRPVTSTQDGDGTTNNSGNSISTTTSTFRSAGSFTGVVSQMLENLDKENLEERSGRIGENSSSSRPGSSQHSTTPTQPPSSPQRQSRSSCHSGGGEVEQQGRAEVLEQYQGPAEGREHHQHPSPHSTSRTSSISSTSVLHPTIHDPTIYDPSDDPRSTFSSKLHKFPDYIPPISVSKYPNPLIFGRWITVQTSPNTGKFLAESGFSYMKKMISTVLMSAFTNTLCILPDDEIAKARGNKSGVKFIACMGRCFKQGSDCVVATSVEECIPRSCNAVLGPGSIGFARWLEHEEDGKLGAGTTAGRTGMGTGTGGVEGERNTGSGGVGERRTGGSSGSSLKAGMKEDKNTVNYDEDNGENIKNDNGENVPMKQEVDTIIEDAVSSSGGSPPEKHENLIEDPTTSSSEENEVDEPSVISKLLGYVWNKTLPLSKLIGGVVTSKNKTDSKNFNQSTTNNLYQHLLVGSVPESSEEDGFLGQQEASSLLAHVKTSKKTSIPRSLESLSSSSNPSLYETNYARFSLQRISIRLRSNPEDSVAILQTFCLIGPNVLLVGMTTFPAHILYSVFTNEAKRHLDSQHSSSKNNQQSSYKQSTVSPITAGAANEVRGNGTTTATSTSTPPRICSTCSGGHHLDHQHPHHHPRQSASPGSTSELNEIHEVEDEFNENGYENELMGDNFFCNQCGKNLCDDYERKSQKEGSSRLNKVLLSDEEVERSIRKLWHSRKSARQIAWMLYVRDMEFKMEEH